MIIPASFDDEDTEGGRVAGWANPWRRYFACSVFTY